MTKQVESAKTVAIADDKKVTIKHVGFGDKLLGQGAPSEIYYDDMKTIGYKKPSLLSYGFIQFVCDGDKIRHTNAPYTNFSKEVIRQDPHSILLTFSNKKARSSFDDFYEYVHSKWESVKHPQ